MLDQIESEDVIVDLISVLIEAAKGIHLVVSTVGDGGVDQTRGSLAQRAGDLRPVAVHSSFLHRRTWHDVGVIGGACRRCITSVEGY